MHTTPKAFILFSLLVLLVGSAGIVPGARTGAAQQAPWESKVDAWVLETGAGGDTEFLVFLAEQADLSEAALLKTKLEKGAFVYQKLSEVAARTQPAVLAQLKARGVEYKPFWVANMIWVRGALDDVQAMSMRSDVAHIYANPKVKADLPSPEPSSTAPDAPEGIEWNILKVNADDVWAEGFTGQGAVIGGQDTGYDWDHLALINQYRGWDGATADHNYNWHDAIHSGGGACGADSPVPCDDHWHGTHTMGTMVGDDGGSNQIGMAPGARWIGCRNMDQGVGTPTTYAECYQWFIAPTDLNDKNPEPSKAPDVIDNSWGCTISEGCTNPNVLLSVVNAVRAAGILTAHSAGNSGSGCSTVDEPAAIYDASYTVGATDFNDSITLFSSRGPVTVDGSGRLKPDISAPGASIRSSTPNGGYGTASGTSMAAPHVAGLVGLLISANPALAGQVDTLESNINQTAVPRSTAQTCGAIPGTQIPNNTYGYGRIDAFAAFQVNFHSFEISKSASSTEIMAGDILTYTLEITYTNSTQTTSNVVLTDTLPAGSAFISATQPYSFDGSLVRWDFASMAAMETKSVELVVQVLPATRGTVINDDYGVRSDHAATVLGDPVGVEVLTLDGMLSKTAPEDIAPGDMLTYTLTVTNPYSNLPVHNLVLTDTIPANTTFITATQPAVQNGDLVTWSLPTLPGSGVWSVDLVVQSSVVYAGEIINDSYAVRSDETQAVAGPAVTTQVHSLALAKSALPELADTGDLITYTLTVTNQNPVSTTTDISLADRLPEHTAYHSSDGNFDPATGVITWTTPSLLPGGNWSVQFVVEVLPGATGAIVNQDYSVFSKQTPEPLYGAPVSTRLQTYIFLPIGYKNHP